MIRGHRHYGRVPTVDVLENLLFPTVEPFTLDWAQNLLLFGIHSTHFPEIIHDDKTL